MRRTLASADVIVVGAGIIGSAIAWRLAQERMSVCLVERAFPASGTSGAGEGNILLGHRYPGPLLDLAKWSRSLWEEWVQRLPGEVEWAVKGGLLLGETEEEAEALREQIASLHTRGVEGYFLDSEALREWEPRLAPDLAGGAWFPQEAQVNPLKACWALAEAACRWGTKAFWNLPATGFLLNGEGNLCGVETPQGPIEAGRVVVAAGPWSSALTAQVGLELPLQPRRGHVLVSEPLPGFVRHTVLEWGYQRAVRERETLQVAMTLEGTRAGNLLIGSSREWAGFQREASLEVMQAILRRAVRFFPDLERVAVIRTYTGFRPSTPDGLPFIGPVPSRPGLYLATGHEGAGICLAPATAELMRCLIQNLPPPIDPAPFSPARLG